MASSRPTSTTHNPATNLTTTIYANGSKLVRGRGPTHSPEAPASYFREWSLSNGVAKSAYFDVSSGKRSVSTSLKSGIVRRDSFDHQGQPEMYVTVEADVRDPAGALAAFAKRQAKPFRAHINDPELKFVGEGMPYKDVYLKLDLAPGDTRGDVARKLASEKLARMAAHPDHYGVVTTWKRGLDNGGSSSSAVLASGIERMDILEADGTGHMRIWVATTVKDHASAIADFAAKQATSFPAFVASRAPSGMGAVLAIEVKPGDSAQIIGFKLDGASLSQVGAVQPR